MPTLLDNPALHQNVSTDDGRYIGGLADDTPGAFTWLLKFSSNNANTVREITVADYTALKTLTPTDWDTITVSDPVRGGVFHVVAGDYSTELAADPEEGVTVGFTANAAGDQFVAVRVLGSNPVTPEMYYDGGGDWTAAINAVMNNAAAPLDYKAAAHPAYFSDEYTCLGQVVVNQETCTDGMNSRWLMHGTQTPSVRFTQSYTKCRVAGFTVSHADHPDRANGPVAGTIDLVSFEAGANQALIELVVESSEVTNNGFTLYGENPTGAVANNSQYNNILNITARRGHTGVAASGHDIRLFGTAQTNTRCNNNRGFLKSISGFAKGPFIAGSNNHFELVMNPTDKTEGMTLRNDKVNGCKDNTFRGVIDSTWSVPSIIVDYTFAEEVTAATFFGTKAKGLAGAEIRADNNGDAKYIAFATDEANTFPAAGEPQSVSGSSRLSTLADKSVLSVTGRADGSGGNVLVSSPDANDTTALPAGGTGLYSDEDAATVFGSVSSDGNTRTKTGELLPKGGLRLISQNVEPDRLGGTTAIDGIIAKSDGTNSFGGRWVADDWPSYVEYTVGHWEKLGQDPRSLVNQIDNSGTMLRANVFSMPLQFLTHNSAVVADSGLRFVDNNDQFGGPNAMDAGVGALITAMNRTGNNARYGKPFAILRVTGGAGTTGSQEGTNAYRQLTLNPDNVFLGLAGALQLAYWVRRVSGEVTFTRSGHIRYVDGSKMSAAFTPNDTNWHHIIGIHDGYNSDVVDLDSDLIDLNMEAGAIVEIAVPILSQARNLFPPHFHRGPMGGSVAQTNSAASLISQKGPFTIPAGQSFEVCTQADIGTGVMDLTYRVTVKGTDGPDLHSAGSCIATGYAGGIYISEPSGDLGFINNGANNVALENLFGNDVDVVILSFLRS